MSLAPHVAPPYNIEPVFGWRRPTQSKPSEERNAKPINNYFSLWTAIFGAIHKRGGLVSIALQRHPTGTNRTIPPC